MNIYIKNIGNKIKVLNQSILQKKTNIKYWRSKYP